MYYGIKGAGNSIYILERLIFKVNGSVIAIQNQFFRRLRVAPPCSEWRNFVHLSGQLLAQAGVPGFQQAVEARRGPHVRVFFADGGGVNTDEQFLRFERGLGHVAKLKHCGRAKPRIRRGF